MSGAPLDPWALLKARTVARIGLGRAGASIATADHLAFQAAHAAARDAVLSRLDVEALTGALEAAGVATTVLASGATDRTTYLARPDLGRALDPASAATLAGTTGERPDVAIAVFGGLSAAGIGLHAAELVAGLATDFRAAGLTVAPVPVVEFGRVALGDAIGERLGARLVVVIVGERPGLTSADAIGAYVTFHPRVGLTDADRNCVSNIRPAGMPLDEARRRIGWLAREALRLELTGTGLKDRSDEALLAAGAPPTAIA